MMGFFIMASSDSDKRKSRDMKMESMVPISKPHNNQTWEGGSDDVMDLRTTNTGETIDSVWFCRSLWKRLKFLLKGEITLSIRGQSIPPVCLHIGDIHE